MEQVDFFSEAGQVRLLTGDFKEPFYLDDAIVVLKLQENESITNQKIKLWQTALDCLEVMLAEAAANASRLREREGGVELEEYRGERYKALKDRYDYLIAHPPEVEKGSEPNVIIIGGTSKKESNRLANNSDIIRTPFKIGEFCDSSNY